MCSAKISSMFWKMTSMSDFESNGVAFDELSVEDCILALEAACSLLSDLRSGTRNNRMAELRNST